MSGVVRIDPTLCRGHAICSLLFSEGIALDHWGYGRVVDPRLGDRRILRKAARAAAACPNGAIVVEEVPEPGWTR